MTTQEQVDQTRALIDQQDAIRQAAVVAAVALALRSTREFDGWYVTGSITAWATQLAQGIEAIQRNLARQLDALMARQASVMTGRPIRPVGAIDPSALRQGITHPGVYGRIADQYRYQQSRLDAEEDVLDALEAALDRAEEIAEMDTDLVVRAQSQRFLDRQPASSGERRLIGYRRMVHPELSKGGSCGMCIVASTRLYQKSDLMPIHQKCKCLPLPVYAGSDPGGLINDSELERFYEEAGGKQRAELQNTRYQIDEHGELGPVLNRAGAAFRTPADVARDTDR